jgi:hypothetical protein
MNQSEENLLWEAEIAATRCTVCRNYGHWRETCPVLLATLVPTPVPPPAVVKTKETYHVEVHDFNAWICAFWAFIGFCAGVAAAGLWKVAQ